MFYWIALICTLIAWAAQAYTSVIKKEKKLNVLLPTFYIIACVLFAVDSFMAAQMAWGIIDVVIAVLALLVLIFMGKGKK